MGAGGSTLSALVAWVSLGTVVAATGILADGVFSSRVRWGLVFLGCCSVLVGLTFF